MLEHGVLRNQGGGHQQHEYDQRSDIVACPVHGQDDEGNCIGNGASDRSRGAHRGRRPEAAALTTVNTIRNTELEMLEMLSSGGPTAIATPSPAVVRRPTGWCHG
jgi:hypothetical protein